jgi:hypothetical protein
MPHPNRQSAAQSLRPALAEDITAALAKHGTCSGARIAPLVGARKADVLRPLRTNPCFAHVGRGSRSVWQHVDSSAPGNRSGTSWEPRYVLASASQILDLVGRVAALEKRLEAVEYEQGRRAT